jgi:hypothetical protein
MVFTITSAPTLPLDYSDLGHPKRRRLHDEFKPACPRFATVCLELERANDCLFRDRDRV